MRSFISLEEAVEIIDNNVNALGIDRVTLRKGVKRILAKDIFSKMNNPPFNKSAMDGYAVRANDTISLDTELNITDKVYAGSICNSEVSEGTAIKIMTGAQIPKGADSVIKQEDVIVKGSSIKVKKILKLNENICFKGEDIIEGQLLVRKNKRLDYADIGILASAGVVNIPVYKKPKVAFISTGDEVLDIDEPLTEGKIYNSNKYSILARVEELGYEISYIAHVNDSYKKIGEEILKAIKLSDLVITTGGASVGKKDLIKEAIDYIHGEKLFWKILIKPGSAMLCSKYKSKLIISLSGNPTAALTTFELIVRSTLDKLSGKEKVEILREKARLIDDYLKKSPQRRFIRGTVKNEIDGQFVSVTQVKSGNGILSSTLNSNCLIEIEAESKGLVKGSIVNIIKL